MELMARVFGLAMLALFLAVLTAVLLGETDGVDAWVLRALREAEAPGTVIGPGWIRALSVTITALGDNLTLLAFTLTGLAWLLFRGDRRAQRLLLIASLGGLLIILAVKIGVGRDRPDVVPWLAAADAWSFPSGHAMMTMVIFLALAVTIGRGIQEKRLRHILIAAAVLLSLATGVTRAVLGVHYPSDVLAGWLLGLAWCTACWLWDARGISAGEAGSAGAYRGEYGAAGNRIRRGGRRDRGRR